MAVTRYIIDWSDPYYPRIQTAEYGDSMDTVAILLIRHHLEVIRAQCRALERVINDATG